ncbi:MAG: PKD domain-containing protein [Saprospiraceae bacterium]
MRLKTILHIISILLLSITFSNTLFARHIIGGVITYECRGNGRYDFVLKMYRDCYCPPPCADFDPVAYIGVYRCSGGNCDRLTQTSTYARIDVQLSPGSVKRVEAPDYPCLIPPDICVQEAEYRFSLTLPVSTESYHISYQRCCRNITINNIIDPESVGATYTVEITPEAQQLCNSSPVFKSFPPTVICADAALEFDHSATDKDGDQLVYEFCSPIRGGGGGALGLDPLYAATCIGAYPTPACPPPYDQVTFLPPAYSSIAPLGYVSGTNQPVLKIDPNTGIITGRPQTLGQFVVGICVSEYRNGVLLSRVFRDFQFNVARCDAQVTAQVKADEEIDGKQFLINACGITDVYIENESFQRQFIRNFEWRFNINNTLQVSKDWSPTITFPGVGQYQGQLLLNPGTDCGDTATVFVNLFPAINADFEYKYDTCVAGPVQFTDLSKSGGGAITAWRWNFGDRDTSRLQNPSHLYKKPGDIPATLIVTDVNRCRDTLTKNIKYFPVPNLILIAPNAFEGCAPADIFFNNLSTPIDETYDIRWDFGDGGTSTAISPTYTYQNPGTYTVSIDITSPIGCQTDTTFNQLISILQAPEAGFTFTPTEPSNLDPTVRFSDQSQRANSWLWDFGNGASAIVQNPAYTYRDTGMYVVTQIVTHPSGCRDTMQQIVDIRPEVRYHLPNAFTPNGDGLNEAYKGVGIMLGATNFSFTVWNRWGELIFETNNPEEGWNGKKNNTGADSPNGVYVVVVTFNGPRGEPFQFKTFATLIR